MEEINQSNNKIQKLKIRSYTTKEKLLEELKQYYSLNDLYLSIKQQRLLGSQYMELISQQLNSLIHLKSLTFIVFNYYYIDIAPFLTALKQLKNLEYLSLMLSGNWFISDKSKIALGESLEYLENLQTFKICLVEYNNQFIELKNAYKRLQNLNTLMIEIRYSIEKKFQNLNLFEGLRYLQSLISFQLKFDYNHREVNQYLSIIGEELMQMKNLKNFDLYNYNCSQLNIQVIQCILQLENLESLVIQYPNQYIGMESSLQGIEKLKNLTSLTININRFQGQIGYDILNAISNSQSLQNITLNLKDIRDNSLTNLCNSMNKILNIVDLEISLLNSCISHHDLINFLISLEKQKKLKRFSLDYDEQQNEEIDIDTSTISKCNQFLQNLEQFQLKFKFSYYFYNQFRNVVYQKFSYKFWSQLLNGLISINKFQVHNTFFIFEIDSKSLKQYQYDYNQLDSQKILRQTSVINQTNQEGIVQQLNALSFQNNLQSFHFYISEYLFLDDDFFQEFNSFHFNKLTKLHLKSIKSNTFSLQGILSLNQGIKRFTNLEEIYLYLKKFYLPNRCYDKLFEPFKYLKNLKDLYLKYSLQIQNEEGISNVIEFPQSLNYLKLRIKQPQQNYENIKGIIKGLACLKSLRSFKIKINLKELEETEYLDMFRALVNLSSLINIYIHFFQSSALTQLYNLFQYLRVLYNVTIGLEQRCKMEFNIQNNAEEETLPSYRIDKEDDLGSIVQLDEKNISHIQNFILSSRISSLQLKIHKDIQQMKIINFFSSFSHLRYLERLDFQIEQIEIQNMIFWIDQLGDQMQNLTSIKNLSLNIDLYDHNNIDEHQIILQYTQLFGTFSLLENLQSLSLSLTVCSTIQMNFIFEQLKKLISLRYLFISYKFMITNTNSIFQAHQRDFINLNTIRISSILDVDKGKQFYKSLDNLNNLRIIRINPKSQYRRQIYKIKRLVLIISDYSD